jgi:hypothetical protein
MERPVLSPRIVSFVLVAILLLSGFSCLGNGSVAVSWTSQSFTYDLPAGAVATFKWSH